MALILYVKYLIYRVVMYFTSGKRTFRPSYPRQCSIAVLASLDHKGKIPVILASLQPLCRDGYHIKLYGYSFRSEDAGLESGDAVIHIFDHKELSCFGRGRTLALKAFQTQTFDYLFHVDFCSNPLLDLLLIKNKALCRVGAFDRKRMHLLDVLVKMERKNGVDDIKRLTDQMVYYVNRATIQ